MTTDAAHADMRIEIVKREINQGALAGFESRITEYAALNVINALDSFDQDALRRAHAEGRAAAAADIRAFVEMKERSVRECPPESAEASRRNDAVLGAYRRAAEIAEGQLMAQNFDADTCELLAMLADAGNTIDAAQAALYRAGHTDPTADLADLITQLAAERDLARAALAVSGGKS
ncbi:MAG TPA: hypothetical protein VIQ30_01020 [Pseudonocardia sp.]